MQAQSWRACWRGTCAGLTPTQHTASSARLLHGGPRACCGVAVKPLPVQVCAAPAHGVGHRAAAAGGPGPPQASAGRVAHKQQQQPPAVRAPCQLGRGALHQVRWQSGSGAPGAKAGA